MKCQLRLGQLVSIWTPHVSDGEHCSLACAQVPLFTSIFPERDHSCHFMLHENSDKGIQCKRPLGLEKHQALSGLMTLKNFVDGGYDVMEGRILVCVKSIGARKKCERDAILEPRLVTNDCCSDKQERNNERDYQCWYLRRHSGSVPHALGPSGLFCGAMESIHDGSPSHKSRMAYRSPGLDLSRRKHNRRHRPRHAGCRMASPLCSKN
jgi:hypothetical protein